MDTDKITYLYVGEQAGLTGNVLKRYVNYMLYRWADNEIIKWATNNLP